MEQNNNHIHSNSSNIFEGKNILKNILKNISTNLNPNSNHIESESLTYTQPFLTLVPNGTKKIKDMIVGFFVDTSTSTNDIFIKYDDKNLTVLDIEKDFCLNLYKFLEKKSLCVGWNTDAQIVKDFGDLKSQGGTSPNCIYENKITNMGMNAIDVAIILTDGLISPSYMAEFAKKMSSTPNIKAVIGVIIKRRTINKNLYIKPSELNVSVLAPAMFSDSCILLYNSNDIYSMWSSTSNSQPHDKMGFNSNPITEQTDWKDVSRTTFEQLSDISLNIFPTEQVIDLHKHGYVNFGSGLFFNPDHFIKYQPTWEELLLFPFDRICQYYKIMNRYNDLFKWFTSLRDKFIAEFISDQNEKNIVNDLFKQIINSGSHSSNLETKNNNTIRETSSQFIKVRDNHLIKKYIDDLHIDKLVKNPDILKLFKFFRTMIGVMEEDKQTRNIGGSYTVSSMTSTRYFNPTQFNQPKEITEFTADFMHPFKWHQQFELFYPNYQTPNLECNICYEKCIPCIILRKQIDTIDNFVQKPLNYIYPSILCAKCCDYFCSQHFDPVRVPCIAAVPLIVLTTNNINLIKNYVNNFDNCINSNSNSNSDKSKQETNIYMSTYFNDISSDTILKSLDQIILFLKIIEGYFVDISNDTIKLILTAIQTNKNNFNNLENITIVVV